VPGQSTEQEAGGRGGPRLSLRRGGEEVLVPLLLRETLLGRIDSNHVVLDDASVSRIHARVLLEGQRVFLEDCASSLGTQVNGEMVDRIELQHGDVIKLGAVALLFFDERTARGTPDAP
jgi:hypothetical protein